jgi:hypothetical protein
MLTLALKCSGCAHCCSCSWDTEEEPTQRGLYGPTTGVEACLITTDVLNPTIPSERRRLSLQIEQKNRCKGVQGATHL